LLDLIETLETAPKPLLMHCRNGVDRSGMASAVAAMLDGQGLEAALRQTPLVRTNDEDIHICDLLAQYRDYCRDNAAVGGGAEHFKRWAAEVYTGQADPSSVLAVDVRFWP
jgi:predicted protein tyrosine phosphatase